MKTRIDLTAVVRLDIDSSDPEFAFTIVCAFASEQMAIEERDRLISLSKPNTRYVLRAIRYFPEGRFHEKQLSKKP